MSVLGMMAKAAVLPLLLLPYAAACGDECAAGSCEDALVLTVELPAEPRIYLFQFQTNAGQTGCVIEVPLVFGSSDCDDSYVVRWAPKDETSASVVEFYMLNAVRADVVAIVEEETVYAGSVDGAGSKQTEQLGTQNYCSGPCFTVRESLDLSDVSIP